MIRRTALRVLTALISLVGLVGCEKKSFPASEAPAAAAPAAFPATDATVRIHWLGSKRISDDRNAAGLVKIWNLPESVRLKTETLDKLSTAPWRLLLGQTNLTATNSLRPLLDDMAAEECYLEIRKASNSPSAPDEIVLAVHLNTEQANLWQTNLAAIAQSLTGQSPQPRSSGGWFLKKNAHPNLIEFARAGEWVVVAAAQDHNALLDETLARIQRQHAPVLASSASAWLEGNIDLSRLARGTNSAPARTLPKISFSVKGDGTNVITAGELAFPDSEPLKFEPWNMPTNLISAELASLTAVRGLKPWLESSGFWNQFQAGSPPDQLYVWALQRHPMETYFAAPIADATNAVTHISELALQKEGPRLLTNALAGFQRSKTFNGLSWQGFPYFTPFLESLQTNGGNFAFGGFMLVDLPPGPPPSGLPEYILGHTNLVYYDREITGLRIEQWILLGQAIRFVSGAAQLPGESASFAWLRAMTTRLGNCDTEMMQTAPARLSFTRQSGSGFSALELHLLADWLESPDFPRGIYSLKVTAPDLPP